MVKYAKIPVIYFLFFIYIYQVVFKVVPISSKFFIYGLGMLYAIPKLVSNKCYLKKEYKGLLRFSFLILLWDMVVCTLNSNLEMYLTRNIIPIVLSIFGANMLYDFSKSYIRSNNDFLRVVVITVFLQSSFAIAMKYIPALYSFFDTIQVFLIPKDDVGDDIVLMTRFIGIGAANYFVALLSCSLGLMTAIRLLSSSNSFNRMMLYVVMYLIIAVFTFFTARTTILLIALSLFFLFLYQGKQHFSRLLVVTAVLCLVAYMAFRIIGQYFDAKTIEWAMEIFTDRDSNSSGTVMDWWINTKFPLKTLLIGDGRYSDGVLLYYKRIDIGVHRQIFYGGIIGLILNLMMHYTILKYVWKNDKTRETRLLTLSLFLSYCLILCKGDAQMSSLFILYLVFYTKGVFNKCGSI